MNYTISVTVTRSGNTESVTSSPVGPVRMISIIGNPWVGETLEADISALSGSGLVSFQWMRNGAVIISPNTTYIVTAADVGSTITVTAERTGGISAISQPIGPVTWPPLTGTVTITGLPYLGETLTANTTGLNGSGTISLYWKQNGIIDIGTGNTYIVQSADLGSTITVTAERSENMGSITSDPTAVIKIVEGFTITFAQLQDLAPGITGPVLRLIGSASETTKTITVANPAQYDSGTIKWFYEGNQITGPAVTGSAGETLTLSSSTYSGIGTYFVTVEVKKNGDHYSKVISFEVKP